MVQRKKDSLPAVVLVTGELITSSSFSCFLCSRTLELLAFLLSISNKVSKVQHQRDEPAIAVFLPVALHERVEF